MLFVGRNAAGGSASRRQAAFFASLKTVEPLRVPPNELMEHTVSGVAEPIIIKALSILVLVILGSMTACSNENNCGVADAMQKLKQVSTDRTTYHLYLKTTGFNDKASFFVLYDKEPTFDSCGRTNHEAVAETYIDTEQGTPARIVLSNKTLEVQYTKNAKNQNDFGNIEIVVDK